jgi:hypothetical protein
MRHRATLIEGIKLDIGAPPWATVAEAVNTWLQTTATSFRASAE